MKSGLILLLKILKSVICLPEDCIIRFAVTLLVLLPLLGSSVISQSSLIIQSHRHTEEETVKRHFLFLTRTMPLNHKVL